jgi:hypothetical protein
MNNLFKKEKAIELDANYSLETDGGNGVSLVFQEERQKEKTEKINGKIAKTGETEAFVFKDAWFFNTVGQALSKYLELSQNSSKTLEEVVVKTDEILKIIQDFRGDYKNW